MSSYEKWAMHWSWVIWLWYNRACIWANPQPPKFVGTLSKTLRFGSYQEIQTPNGYCSPQQTAKSFQWFSPWLPASIMTSTPLHLSSPSYDTYIITSFHMVLYKDIIVFLHIEVINYTDLGMFIIIVGHLHGSMKTTQISCYVIHDFHCTTILSCFKVLSCWIILWSS